MWSKDIVNSVFIKRVEDSDNDETLSPVEFKMEQDKILRIIRFVCFFMRRYTDS